jgi:hypothetical protein
MILFMQFHWRYVKNAYLIHAAQKKCLDLYCICGKYLYMIENIIFHLSVAAARHKGYFFIS